MKATLRIVAVLGLLSLVPPSTVSNAEAGCPCDEDEPNGGWCEIHRVGRVAGVEIRSETVYEAIDAHGHVIRPEYIRCPTCREARETDGFCDEHRTGFVGGLAYLSTLTYELARGETRELSGIACPVCRKNAESRGWCPGCGVGMLGSVEIRDPEAFRAASRAHDTLLRALETIERCELCAAAMVADGRCPVCKISYRDGEPVDTGRGR